jgi:hypothetical protein
MVRRDGERQDELPVGIVNVSAVVTAFAVIAPEPPKVPADEADHCEKCV